MRTINLRTSSIDFKKIKLIYFCVFLSLFLANTKAFAGCAGDPCEFNCDLFFFSPEVIKSQTEEPFFLSSSKFYSSNINDQNNKKDFGVTDTNILNINEWIIFFNNKLSKENLNYLVYKMNLEDLDQVIFGIQGKSSKINKESQAIKAELESYYLNNKLNKEKVIKALYYIGFAKRIESFANREASSEPWNAPTATSLSETEIKEVEKLIKGGLGLLQNVKNSFLEDRYRFQIIRLYFHSKNHKKAQDFYTNNIDFFKNESSIKFRFMQTAVGAFYRDKNYGMANYLNSIIFDKYVPLKKDAYLFFHPQEEKDWNQSLSLAKSSREKQVLWQLFGLYADGNKAIEKIYELQPKSDLLLLLLTREVNKSEDAIRNIDNLEQHNSQSIIGKVDSLNKRLVLIKKITDENKVIKGYLWQLALAHLYASVNNVDQAKHYLSLANQMSPNESVIKDQIRMTSFFIKIKSLMKINKQFENEIAQELSWLKESKNFRAISLNEWARRYLSKIYHKNGDDVRSYLLQRNNNFIHYNKNIDALEKFYAQKSKSSFDKYLIQNNQNSFNVKIQRAENLIYLGDFNSGLSILKELEKSNLQTNTNKKPETYTTTSGADPFLIHINDCHDCDIRSADSHSTYSALSLVEKLSNLQSKTKSKGQGSAQASFEIANALYNISYYGNSRILFGAEDPIGTYGNMDQAEKYYVLAMNSSNDKEFKAKAAFMAAKTERNRSFNLLYNARLNSEHEVWTTDFLLENQDVTSFSPKYFEILKKNFSKTKYYQEAIQECGYFRKFLEK